MSDYWVFAPEVVLLVGLVVIALLAPFLKEVETPEQKEQRQHLRAQRRVAAELDGYTGRLCARCGGREFSTHSHKGAMMSTTHRYTICKDCGY